MSDDTQARSLIEALRTGAVPRTGLDRIATGLDALMQTVEEELEYVASGNGHGKAKWVRGGYGSGKTFATRLLAARARAAGFATAEVQISVNDTPLHHLETVYRRLMERLVTGADGDGALQAVVDGWIFEVGEEVTRLRGLTDADPEFADAVGARLEDKLAELSARNPAFAQVLRAYHEAMLAGDFATAQALLGWLAGQPHVDRSVLSRAGVKGAVDGQAALTFLRGLLVMLRQSGHRGLVVILDEVETIQRMPAPTREKAFNALRQLVDMLLSDELPGLYLVVTGTPELFEGYKGLKSLTPLYQRVETRFDADPRFDNLRAPQVRLPPFDRARLVLVGRRVRDLYVAQRAPERVAERVSDPFLDALVDHVTAGFGGRVDVAPRIFLRELVDVMDKVDQHEEYLPAEAYRLQLDEDALEPEELIAARGEAPSEAAGDDGRPPRRRLDG